MMQFDDFSKSKIKTMYFMMNAKNSETALKIFFMLCMINVCSGEARQYGEPRNDLFSRPEGRGNRRNGGQMKLLTPDESNADVLKELGVDLSKEVPEASVSSVQGSSVDLPCNVTAPIRGDKVRLVLWFKNESSLPIYTYDTRGNSHEEARHWSDDKVLGGRAFFRGDHDPARLVLDNVKGRDEASYKCRVDFRQAPTRISNIDLHVIVPPEKPRVYTVDDNKEIRLKLGPYRVGETVRVRCEALGGRPQPQVTWWRDHALLDDSYVNVGHGAYKVENELVIPDLQRSDLHSILTCQAANNNISVPVSTSVKLDMNFGPTSVTILNKKDPVSAGKEENIQCQTVGARPPPTITWWLAGKQIRSNFDSQTTPDGNVTVSTYRFIPSTMDAGSQLVCRAGNVRLPDSTLEDSWRLKIHYIPSSTLTLGSSLNASNIKEGDDVYFECAVQASPAPYKITWRHNGRELSHNVAKRVIISNRSLVLQKVGRSEGGVYTCTAHNSEGDGVSNSMSLDVKFKPFCKPGQVKVYGVAKHEKIHVSCEVLANPKDGGVKSSGNDYQTSGLKFEWVFNSSSEKIDLPQDRIEVVGSRSLAEHMPKTEMDYGSLMCWATNSVGRQDKPCVYHLIPAGRPEPVSNCTVLNQTYSTLHVACKAGFDGGLPQSFSMQVKDSKTHFTVANTTNMRRAAFTVTGLVPGTGYIIVIDSSNSKGRSIPVRLHAFTTKVPDHIDKNGAPLIERNGKRGGSGHSRFKVTPILAILLAVGGALVLVFLVLSAFLCIRRKPSSSASTSARRRKSQGQNDKNGSITAKLINSNGNSTIGQSPSSESDMTGTTHIPLQRGIDDCITDHGGQRHSQASLSSVTDRNPDLIPTSSSCSKDCSTSEEDGGFGVYGEKTRYATLQRLRTNNSQHGSHHHPNGGYETLRPNASTSAYNVPSLSQEVTYAELGTLPRRSNGVGGGYAQLRPTQNGVMTSDEPAVVYARINHGSNNGRMRPMGNEDDIGGCNPAGCSIPLLVSTNGMNNSSHLSVANPHHVSNGHHNTAGISPNSLMNTSLDSASASSTTSSRCHTANSSSHQSGTPSTSGANTKIHGARASSSTDDGFVSCSSPVGNLGVSKRNNGAGESHLPIIISPHSDLTGDTINLVSRHPSTNFNVPTSSLKASQVVSLPVHSPGLNTSSCSACLASPPYGNLSTPSTTSSSSSSALRISPPPTSYCSSPLPTDRNGSSFSKLSLNKFSNITNPHNYTKINGMDISSHNISNPNENNSSNVPVIVDCRESTV